MDTARDHENWRSLHDQLRGIARRRAALDAEEARCLRDAYAMKLWRQLGYAYMNEYLERELGYSPQVGIERLRVAHALADLPQIEASLDAGHLAFSAVRELTRVATTENEHEWLGKVRGKNLREIEALVSGKKRGDRPEDPGNPDLTMRVVRLELAPAVFALFRQVQGAMADEHGGRLDDSALIEVLCRRALEGGGPADKPAYQLAITQCEGCGRAWQNGAGREVDVGPEVAERARCDAEIIGSLDAREPERARTTVTTRVRRQVFARDHYRCTVPGCRSARNLDIHHVEYQSQGGSHEMQNLTVLCSAHHASLHENRLTIRGTAPDALQFTWREDVGPRQHDAPPSPPAPGTRVDNRARRVDDRGPRVDDHAPDAGTERPTMKNSPPSAEAAIDPSSGGAVHCEAQPTTKWSAPSTEASTDPATARQIQRPGSRGIQRSGPKGATPEDALPLDPATIDAEACLALTTAGYRPREARVAVETARPHVGASATLEQLIREALRQCNPLAARLR